MNPEEIIREAIAFTEVFIDQQDNRDIPPGVRYKQRRDFPVKMLAILRDEVY